MNLIIKVAMRIYLVFLAAILAITGLNSPQASCQNITGMSVGELVDRLPAENSADQDDVISRLVASGNEAILFVINNLVAPGRGDDVKHRYALSGIVKHVGQGNDPYLKINISASLCKALSSATDPEVKDFILQELQYIAGDEAVLYVAPYLSDKRLADPAARVLVNIGSTHAGGALLHFLSRSEGETGIKIVQAIGELAYSPAAPQIRQFALSDDPALRAVSLQALASIGDIESACVLFDAAKSAGYDYEQTRATSSWLLLLENMIRSGNKPLADKMIYEAINSGKVPVHTIIALMKI